MTKALTDLDCKRAKPDPDKRIELPDGRVPGLALRVTPGGIKSWSFIYRQHGKRHRINLGRYPAVKLSEAREKATDAQGLVYKGETPGKARRVLSGTEIATVESLKEAFVEAYRKSGKRTWKEVEADLDNHILPKLGNHPPDQLRRSDIIPVLRPFEHRPSTYNKLITHLGAMFTWAAENDYVGANPVSAIKRKRIVSRDRVLSGDELKAIWKAALEMGWPWSPFFRLLILTAQRRGEVASMHRAHIEGDTWSIPGSLTKNGRPHIVPLVSQAEAVLEDCPTFKSPYVFPARGNLDNHISGFSKAKADLDKQSGVKDWRVHDLRRTAATGMASLQIPTVVIEAVLNHVSGQQAGVAGVYNRHQYLDEKREALEAWGHYVEHITSRS